LERENWVLVTGEKEDTERKRLRIPAIDIACLAFTEDSGSRKITAKH